MPTIRVFADEDIFIIDTMQYYYENEDRIIIKCAEYVPIFKRGLVCDLEIENELKAEDKSMQRDCYRVNNVVLVYINRDHSVTNYPEVEYVFYK